MSSANLAVHPETLKAALEMFLGAADRGEVDAVVDHYHADFVCVRTATADGTAGRIDRAGMINFWRSQACRADGRACVAPCPEVPATEILLVESLGDWGATLLLREKNFGPGCEKVFYNLVWRREDERWLLWLEFVQQRHVPTWAKGGAA